MEIIEKLNAQVDKLIHDYELLKFENDSLKLKIKEMKNKQDELERNNQDMMLNIDRALTISKVKKSGKEDNISY